MRLIDAGDLLKWLDEWWGVGETWIETDVLADYIHAMPTIEAEPVKHGRWEQFGCYNQCSACNEAVCVWDDDGEVQHFNFCPRCGAKMDE